MVGRGGDEGPHGAISGRCRPGRDGGTCRRDGWARRAGRRKGGLPVMNEQIWWYTARASGIVALAILTASIVWGLLYSNRVLNGRPTAKWLLDLHRFLGGLAVTFTAVHLAGLVADSYVEFGWSELFIPMASAWKTGT